MEKQEIINMGIGFVTGRKNFRKVLKTYVYRWKQTSAAIKNKVRLHLFVAYDLDYNHTQIDDYVNIRPDILDIIDSVFFISKSMIQNEIIMLDNQKIVSQKDATLFFDKGYAGHRNTILYYALKRKIDYLIYLDDDEYPVAVTRTRNIPVWSGQDIFATHLMHLGNADITNGLHCGYISPIPHIEFSNIVTESDFRLFIEAISNDILEWDKIRRLMNDGGVTYANPQIFIDDTVQEVKEINHAKFISGSNLGINLMNPKRVKPFFNPPKARGEDAFFFFFLSEHRVLRVPCYTFHDGFSIYSDLLDGVLPLQLKHVDANTERVVSRFYKACIGWVRYKPLYLFITKPDRFAEETVTIKSKLAATVPKLCKYFDNPCFQKIIAEFDKYCRKAVSHHQLFLDNQRIWEHIRDHAVQHAFSSKHVLSKGHLPNK
jgi:septum formation topological specificity factor MinE